jgi:CHAT domain-containing protein
MSALYRLLTEVPNRPHVPVETVPKMLLVAQPTANGLPSLANVFPEIEQIQTLIPPDHIYSVRRYDGRELLVGDVLGSLQHTDILHLACHGVQDQDNPMNSGFELKDGRLTLGQLMRLNTSNAQLAYLSACESAGMDETRPDEGLNLVGTMIFVGFKSVVGTMW